MMKIKKSPNHWSCLLSAFSMLYDCSPQYLIDKLGHDGSKIIWPEESEPYNRRSFHPQEFIDLASGFNCAIITIEALPSLSTSPDLPEYNIFDADIAENRIKICLQNYDCVISGMTNLGARHAIAWDHNERLAFCPNYGIIYSIDDFQISHLFLKVDLKIKS